MNATFAVERCADARIRPTVEADHYLHRWPHPGSLPFGYRLRRDGQAAAPDGRPWGLVVLKRLQHSRQGGLFGYAGLPTCWQVLDLARVWVHPDLQAERRAGRDRRGREALHATCAFSRMVAAVLRRVQRDWLDHHPPRYPERPYHIELVVSYCEQRHHDGTAYRASGFTRSGATTDGTKEIYVRRLRRPRWHWKGATMQATDMTALRAQIQPGDRITWFNPDGGEDRYSDAQETNDHGIRIAGGFVPWTAPGLAKVDADGNRAAAAAEYTAMYTPAGGTSTGMVPLVRIRPSPINPRKLIPEEGLAELTESIRAVGLIQPLVVRPTERWSVMPDMWFGSPPRDDGKLGWFVVDRLRLRGRAGAYKYAGQADVYGSEEEAAAHLPQYEILAGERRWRAAARAGLTEVPAVIRTDVDDLKALRMMYEENERRAALNPMERAEALAKMHELGARQTSLAEDLGVRQATISRNLSLLKLPPDVQELVRAGKLSGTHAERLVWLAERPKLCSALAEIVVEHDLPTRDLEGRKVPRPDLLLKKKLARKLPGAAKFAWQQVCPQCPFHAYVKGEGYNDAFCLRPEHIRELNREHEEAVAARFEGLRQQAAAEGKELHVLDSLKYGSFEQLGDAEGQLYSYRVREGCTAACPCRHYGVNYCGQMVPICTDPVRLRNFPKAPDPAQAGVEARRRQEEEEHRNRRDHLVHHVQERGEISSRDLVVIGAAALEQTTSEQVAQAAEVLGLDLSGCYEDWHGRRVLTAQGISVLPPAHIRSLFVVLQAIREERWGAQALRLTPWYLGDEKEAVSTYLGEEDAVNDLEECSGCMDDLPAAVRDWAEALINNLPDPPPVSVHETGAILTGHGLLYCMLCAANLQVCRGCGCTSESPCEGGCGWVQVPAGEEPLCSGCAEAGAVLEAVEEESGRKGGEVDGLSCCRCGAGLMGTNSGQVVGLAADGRALIVGTCCAGKGEPDAS